jgi:hypothetical protein
VVSSTLQDPAWNSSTVLTGDTVNKEIDTTENPDALAFELNGVILAADVHFILHGNEGALDTARQVVRRRLGVTSS